MHIYLPIAELTVNALTIIILGGLTGILSGMFGVGGGFLLTPFMIFMGVSPSVAVATSTNQIIAVSISSFIVHWRKGNVDFQMGFLVLLGSLVGSGFGVWLFSFLKSVGQIDLIISISYVLFLGTIGTTMGIESYRNLKRSNAGIPAGPSTALRHLQWVNNLPMQRHFAKSNVTISAFAPVIVGALVGVVVSIMGIGGGFLMIPAMIYLLGMPTSLVVGTSLFQVIFTTSQTTVLYAVTTQSVDIVLALLLLSGSVIGAQYGTKIGLRLPAEKLRLWLAALTILVALRMAFELFVHPLHVYNIEMS